MEVVDRTTHSIPITAGDDSQTGNARRQSMTRASALDFSELRCGQLGIIVTELARNLALHGGGGELLLTPWEHRGSAGLDILALDQGDGIADIAAAMTDGYSTGGTAGSGLGAVQRLAALFQLYSKPGKGTAVFARILRTEADTASHVEVCEGSVNRPIAGETLCGDGWASHFDADRTLYIMADGLGHGPVAHDAAAEALSSFAQSTERSPKQMLLDVHSALQKTRGAAIAIAEIRRDRKVLTYVGSGNIAASLVSEGKSRSLVSMNGTPGHNMSTPQEFTYPWVDGSLLIMHSDGLGTRWSLADYPGLASRHPALIAGVLYRDHNRKRDDATVLVTGLSV